MYFDIFFESHIFLSIERRLYFFKKNTCNIQTETVFIYLSMKTQIYSQNTELCRLYLHLK